MLSNKLEPSRHPLAEYIHRLEAGEALLKDSPRDLIEVVGVLKSYGIVLDAYSRNLNYIAENQFLVFFPFFKYFNGEITFGKLMRYLWHDRINYEYAEYCMKGMFWHGGTGLDAYLDSGAYREAAEKVIQAKFRRNPFVLALHRLFPEFLPEQMRQMAYYTALGQFWRVMSDIFLSLSDRYDRGEIQSIPEVVSHILSGLVKDANRPITYKVSLRGETYELIPESANLTFLQDTAIPYVESIFFRGAPFPGTVSYNAQAYQVPAVQADFAYGALYADPIPVGGAGIPPTLLMQDLRHFIPDYLQEIYLQENRKETDLRVKIAESFQKSMYCVTTAAIQGLAPHPLDTDDLQQAKENRQYLEQWMDRFVHSRIQDINRADR
jgi:CO2 hydration protein